MQSTGFLEHVDARTEIEMIGVAEYYLSLDIIAQFVLMHRLDAAERTYGHKYRCLDGAVVSSYEPGTS